MPDQERPSAHLTERQQKWFASVRASLERDTGQTFEAWVAIARTCPETRPQARIDWLRTAHGLGINSASQVMSAAFPSGESWADGAILRAKLWGDPASEAILSALEAAVARLPDTLVGHRKSFTGFFRKVQMAAARPMRGGHALVGLAVPLDADPRLAPRGKSVSWGERLKSQRLVTAPHEIDAAFEALLKRAWENA